MRCGWIFGREGQQKFPLEYLITYANQFSHVHLTDWNNAFTFFYFRPFSLFRVILSFPFGESSNILIVQKVHSESIETIMETFFVNI